MQYIPALISWPPLRQLSFNIKVMDCYSNFDNSIIWYSNPFTFVNAYVKKLFLAKGLHLLPSLMHLWLPGCEKYACSSKCALLLNTCITSSIGKDVIKLELRINLFCFVLISNHYSTLILWWSTARFRFQCKSLFKCKYMYVKIFYYSGLKSY